MAPLSAQQVAAVALAEGLSDEKAALFVGIAKYESGWDPAKRNVNARTGDDSWGLWQINMIASLNPAGRRQQFGITSNEQLLDPRTNAKAMRILSGTGSTTQPWRNTVVKVTEADLREGRQAVADVRKAASDANSGGDRSVWDRIAGGLGGSIFGIPGIIAGAAGAIPNPFDVAGDAIGAVSDALGAIGDIFAALTSWNFWARVLQFTLGAGLVVVGLLVISQDTLTEATEAIA